MNILLVEDRGEVSVYLKLALRDDGHQVLDAFNPNDAMSHWNNRRTIPIDCIILDLNLRPDGLTETERKASRGGLISGWLWLKDYVLTQKPDMASRTIVYSDYLHELQAAVTASEYQGVALVPKKGRSSPAQEVMKHIQRIAGMSSSGR